MQTMLRLHQQGREVKNTSGRQRGIRKSRALSKQRRSLKSQYLLQDCFDRGLIHSDNSQSSNTSSRQRQSDSFVSGQLVLEHNTEKQQQSDVDEDNSTAHLSTMLQPSAPHVSDRSSPSGPSGGIVGIDPPPRWDDYSSSASICDVDLLQHTVPPRPRLNATPTRPAPKLHTSQIFSMTMANTSPISQRHIELIPSRPSPEIPIEPWLKIPLLTPVILDTEDGEHGVPATSSARISRSAFTSPPPPATSSSQVIPIDKQTLSCNDDFSDSELDDFFKTFSMPVDCGVNDLARGNRIPSPRKMHSRAIDQPLPLADRTQYNECCEDGLWDLFSSSPGSSKSF